ncbi:MAG: hypothetical protein ABR981_00220 [Candidatus Micrarchaeaceae archaeon]|jgi:hypothetical protein
MSKMQTIPRSAPPVENRMQSPEWEETHAAQTCKRTIKGYEHNVVECTGASYVTLGNHFGACGIRILMSRQQFDSIKNQIELEMEKAIPKTTPIQQICVTYGEKGFGTFSYGAYTESYNTQAQNELIGIGAKIKEMLQL